MSDSENNVMKKIDLCNPQRKLSNVRQKFKSPLINKLQNTKNCNLDYRGEKRKLDEMSQMESNEPSSTRILDTNDFSLISSSEKIEPSNVLTPVSSLAMKRNLKRFNSPFRSPITKQEKSDVELENEYQQLVARNKELDDEIAELENEGLTEEHSKIYIDKLHHYNEIKDIAQVVIGRLAEMEGITIKDVHERYNAPMTD